MPSVQMASVRLLSELSRLNGLSGLNGIAGPLKEERGSKGDGGHANLQSSLETLRFRLLFKALRSASELQSSSSSSISNHFKASSEIEKVNIQIEFGLHFAIRTIKAHMTSLLITQSEPEN